MLKNYGRSSKLLLAEKDIPDLHFDTTETKEKGESSERTDVMEIINVEIKRNYDGYAEQRFPRTFQKICWKV